MGVEGEDQGSHGPKSMMDRLARASGAVYTCVGMDGTGCCWVTATLLDPGLEGLLKCQSVI